MFKDPDSFGPSMTYELYSGLQSLTWDNSVLFQDSCTQASYSCGSITWMIPDNGALDADVFTF